MHQKTWLLALVAVAALATPAAAAITLETSNPLDASPWSTDFDNPTQASAMAVALTLDDGAGNQIAVAGAPIVTSEIFYFCINGDCGLMSWIFGGADEGAARLTFVPAVSQISIRIRGCVTDAVGATASGPAGADTLPMTAGNCAVDSWVVARGAAGGVIDELVLRGMEIQWDDMFVDTGALPLATDLAVAGGNTRGVGGVAAHLDFTTRNLGPEPASGVALDVLVEPLTDISPAAPDGRIRDDLGDIAVGDAVSRIFDVTPPPGFDCHGQISLIGVGRSPGLESDAANNIAVRHLVHDPAARLTREDCQAPGDEDCDGMYGCADADCAQTPACRRRLTIRDVQDGDVPWDLWPPLLPPFVGGEPDGPSVPAPMPDPSQPAPADACTIRVHGEEQRAAPYCCEPPPGATDPLFADYHANCVPLDPNAKEAEPAVGNNGVGYTAAGQRIRYTLHYENIGAADAHDVAVIDRLPDDLDADTLEIEDGGSFDPETRTLTWIDPEVFPADPREVHYSAEVRAGAPLGTRIRNVATIVFPDAVPPTRIDTNPVEHVIPTPGATIGPILFVSGCRREADGSWRVLVQNRGLTGAYNVSARAVETPEGVAVSGAVSFANDSDPTPDRIASVVPFATTASLETVDITGTDEDVCAEITWEITYRELRDPAPRTVTVRAVVPAAGAGCCSSSGGDGPTTLVLALLAFAVARRRM